MSLFDFAIDPTVITFFSLAVVTIVSSILVIAHKSLVYSAFFLGVLGMANAALFALLGFTFIALFHVAVYIGAAVTFILFSITMFEEVPSVERPIRFVAAFSAVLTFVLLVGAFALYFGKAFQPMYVDYRVLAGLLVEKYWFALIVAALTLVTTLIEAITLARLEDKS
jgi:NADH-quinone oxidoreductase subunit J